MMRIAVTSQNFRTVTGHAGKTRKFLVYEATEQGTVREAGRISLPKELSIHAAPMDEPHPLDGMNYLITGSCGQGFVNKMAMRGVQVFVTETEDPAQAVEELLAILPGRTLH